MYMYANIMPRVRTADCGVFQAEVVRLAGDLIDALVAGLNAIYEPLWLTPLKAESLRRKYFDGETVAAFWGMGRGWVGDTLVCVASL